MKQLAFLIISSTPSLKNIAQISSHSFWPNQFIFIVFCISTLYTVDGTLNLAFEWFEASLILPRWLYLNSFLAIDFLICAKKEKKRKEKNSLRFSFLKSWAPKRNVLGLAWMRDASPWTYPWAHIWTRSGLSEHGYGIIAIASYRRWSLLVINNRGHCRPFRGNMGFHWVMLCISRVDVMRT